MKHAIAQPRSFGRESPVLEYWLGRCEGFELVSTSGGQLGVVEDVMRDDAGRAVALVMRTTILGRRRTVDPRLAESVVPESEAIAIQDDEPPPVARKPRVRAGAVIQTVGTGARRVGPPLREGLMGLARLCGVAAVKALSALVTGSRWVARRLRRHVPIALARTQRATVGAARWVRPLLAALARLVLALLVSLGTTLVRIGCELALALRAYRSARARDAARRRAAP